MERKCSHHRWNDPVIQSRWDPGYPHGLFWIDRTDLFIPVAEKFGRIGWIRWLGKHLNFLFVDRFNPDLKAIRKMISLMESGKCLVIAPEGTAHLRLIERRQTRCCLSGGTFQASLLFPLQLQELQIKS
jgi:1-acyl-sn-glycerol-3-phosphate acyltransferase